MDKRKIVTEEEEESFLSLLLNNQTDCSLEIADALVGESFEMHNDNASQVDEEPAKQVASEPEEQPLTFRKAIPPQVLRDLSVRDPKRARRIIANRMSAARAKAKTKLQIYTLENELQNLQDERNATSTRLAFLQDEREELTNESSRLKERVTMILKRIYLQDELNERLKKQVKVLKTKIGSGGLNHNNAKPDDGTQQ